MKRTHTTYMMLLALTVIALFGLAGCGGGGSSPTGPSNPPQLSGYQIENNQPVSAGATIAVRIDYVDISGSMKDGIAYITYSEGTYTSTISNASGTSGTMLISFDLSPLVTPGQVLVKVWVQNGDGVSSNEIDFILNVS